MKVNNISIKPYFIINHSSNNQRKQSLISSNADNVSFGMGIDYGTPAKLAEPLQQKILNIHENIDLIQEFFKRYTVKNPQLGAKIKRGYSDLIPKRQSGIVFKLPNSENTIEIMRSQTRKNVLYISINDESYDFNGIVIDGKDKLVANYLRRHPHMLPREIKYMNVERMKEAEPEKFINIADEKLQDYGDYVRKLKSGEIPMPRLSKSDKILNKTNKPVEKTQKKTIKNNNLEELKQEMRELGKTHGSIAATEYFNAFKKQFMADIQQKMTELSSNFHKLVELISK